jgi:hypothetical protein
MLRSGGHWSEQIGPSKCPKTLSRNKRELESSFWGGAACTYLQRLDLRLCNHQTIRVMHLYRHSLPRMCFAYFELRLHEETKAVGDIQRGNELLLAQVERVIGAVEHVLTLIKRDSAQRLNRAAQTGVFDLDIRISNRPFIDVCKSFAAETGLQSRNVEKRINAV